MPVPASFVQTPASGIERLGAALFGDPLVLVLDVVLVAMLILHHRSVLGLRLAAVGESTLAAAAAGLGVRRLRVTALVIAGALAGLGGVWLAYEVRQFTDGMSAGRGYLALAAVVFGRWRPAGAVLGCLGFGLAAALAELLERHGGLGVPSQLVGALPYVVALGVLVGWAGRARPPAMLGNTADPA